MRSPLVSFSLLMSLLAMTSAAQTTIKPGAVKVGAPMTPPKQGSFDRTAIGEYIKTIEMWPKELELKISDPKPSSYLPGFQEFTVGAVYQGNEVLQRQYYLSADGQRFIQGNVFVLSKHPFQKN